MWFGTLIVKNATLKYVFDKCSKISTRFKTGKLYHRQELLKSSAHLNGQLLLKRLFWSYLLVCPTLRRFADVLRDIFVSRVEETIWLPFTILQSVANYC